MGKEPVKLLIALGSNVQPRRNIALAKQKLATILSDISYSESIATKPVGTASKAKFLNCLGLAHTTYAYPQLERVFKTIERQMGSTFQDRVGDHIRIDIDILEYDGERHHEADWDRQYIKDLMHYFDDKN